jgi:hypothetical protein
MAIITIVSFTNMQNSYDNVKFKGIFLSSLIFIFPLLFLLQGVISGIDNTNIFISIGISLLTYIILMFIYLNSSAFIYAFIYLVFGLIGYSISYYSIKKLKK